MPPFVSMFHIFPKNVLLFFSHGYAAASHLVHSSERAYHVCAL